MIHNNNIFSPSKVAVIGASEKQNAFQGKAIRYLLEHSDNVESYPVNPKYDNVYGKKCYKSVEDIPVKIDAAIVVVRSEMVPDVLRQCGEKGCKLAVVISAAFSESGDKGLALEEEVKRVAKHYGIRIIGPNCVGFINFIGRKALSTSTALERKNMIKGKIGFVSQSGAIMGSIIDRAQDAGIGFSYAFSIGNGLDLDVAEIIDFLAHDEDTEAIIAYVEGIKDYTHFSQAALKARKSGKPVFICKIGKSEEAVKTAATHTGSMTGTDEIIDAYFKQLGIIRVDDIEELFTAANLYLFLKPIQKSEIGIFSVSGGAAGLLADYCSNYGLKLGDVSDQTAFELLHKLQLDPPYNPLDIARLPIADLSIVSDFMKRFAVDPAFGAVIISLTMVYFIDEIADIIIKTYRETNRPVIVYWTSGSVAKLHFEKITAAGIPLFHTAHDCIASLRYAMRFFELNPPGKIFPDYSTYYPQETNKDDVEIWLDEKESKDMFLSYGIPVTEQQLVISPEEAVKASKKIGYPVVMKICSKDIQHKSDYGLVKLNIENPEAVITAFAEITGNSRKHFPQATVNGVLVQEMVSAEIEFILGATKEAGLGPVILFGLGGVFVEVFKDSAVRVAQFMTEDDARSIVKQTKASIFLSGLRGQKKLDEEALVDIILKLQKLVLENPAIEQLDINPLYIFEEGKGVKAIDGLVKLSSN